MAFIITFMACFLLYGTSKYFPESLQSMGGPLRKNKKGTLVVALLFLGSSMGLFVKLYNDAPTGLLVWAVVLMMTMSALLLSIKLHRYWLFFWGLLMVGMTIYEFVYYAG
ncbi:hypothetical protein FNH22_06730 [Fulvivirga sp. M361]|uniref:hypothetical protein n=1 Tax=Fulvivirga sp. M361 TaxID=2594266 RepID=UPI00117A477E|nr:hypothetical protein [Fulvivirga sp. M361]TRX60734.1 hypothetical protein FNH22_06730 [Fulvivirga sp. M361]